MSRLKLNVIQSLWVLISIIIYSPISSQDNTPPEITIPAQSLTVSCSSTNILGNLTNWYNDHGGAEATDNSGTVEFIAIPSLTNAISIFESSTDTLCGITKSVRVTFIAVDPDGNESEPTSAKFSTFDNVNPVISTPAQNVSVACTQNVRDSLISWIQNHGNALATDACSDTIIWTTFVSNLPPFGSFPIDIGPYPNLPSDKCDLSINITFFVEDDCGNKTTTSGTFRMTDTQGPVLDTLPVDITVSCDNIPEPATIKGFDACYGEVIVGFEEESNQNADSTSCEHYNYDILRQWSAMDLCNNVTTHNQIIAVRDLNPPSIVVTNPLVVGCKDILIGNVMNNIDSLYDDCSDSLTVSFTDNGTIANCEYSLLRIYSVKDLCDNETQTVQTLLIRDTIPPTITVQAKDSVYDCGVDINFNQAFQQWLDDNAGSQSIDECSSISIFPAVPGSYDIDDPFSYPGIDPDTFDMNNCPSGLSGFLRYETVDFLHIDECQNIAVTTATFGIVDNSVPIISNCPPDITVTLDQDNCSTMVGQVFPSASDNCTATTSPIRKSVTVSVTSSDPGNPEVIVDTVRVSIGPFNTNTFDPLAPPVFKIEMQNLDADDNTEYFTIFNESGINIGQTPPTQMQCGDTTFTIENQSFDDLVSWLSDGYIEFTFAPNSPPSSGVLGINAVCSGARLIVEAIIEISPINTLSTSFQVNNNNPTAASIGDSINFEVSVGPNNIIYYFEDCASNKAECTQIITANDIYPPEIDCGDTLNFSLDTNQCAIDLGFPLDISVSENCQFAEAYRQTFPVSQEAQLMIFEYDSINMRHLATNRLFTFNNVEKIKYGNEAFLYVEVNGDLNDIGETITIRGEDGVSLGKTKIIEKPGCQESVLSISIPRSAFNLWAADGKIDILALAPTGLIEGGGINPCVPISPEMTVDGISTIKTTLVYYDAQIYYSINGDTTVFQVENDQDSIFANLINGENFLDFNVEDLGGNVTSCRKIIMVNDSIAPQAKCRNGTVEIHPSGLISNVVHPDSINDFSTDNCAIDSLRIKSDTLTCEDIGQTILATLYVYDQAGNIDSCQANVEVVSYQLEPFFTAGLCSGDTLKLFANVPEAPVSNTYTFEWLKDGVVISNDENPVIPNATSTLNGIYILNVNGFAGCSSQGTVLVDIMPLTKPDISASEESICFGESVTLNCTSFSGTVVYSWYQGTQPSGTLIGTSAIASFDVTPTMTNNSYYVIVNNTECETPPSDHLLVVVYAKPVPEVEESFITLCEGELVNLKATNMDIQYSYEWFGPDNFNSMLKEPTPFIASSIKAGTYQLVVSIGECNSDTALVTVATLGRPETPIINGEAIYCKGSTFSLAVNNVTNGTTYMWYKNGLLFRTTQDNSLDIPNAQTDLTGDWTVVVIRDGCESLASLTLSVTVDDLINVGATNSGPVCAGDSIVLDATFVPNANYQWSGPGFFATGQTVKAPSVAGDYSVTITTPTNCSNVASTEVIVNTPPEITALSSDNPNCVTENTVISFSPTIFPTGSYDYSWTGPNGFASTILNPTLSNLEISDTGTYTLIVTSFGCESNPVAINIDFEFKPTTPNISGLTEYCQGDSIKISSTGSTSENYNWLTPTGLIQTSINSLIIPNAKTTNEGIYTLTSSNGACISDTSNALNIIIKDVPPPPIISGEDDVCFGSSVLLTSNILIADEYVWTLPDNSTINNDSIIISNVNKTNEGSYQLTYNLEGCQSFVSDMFVLNVRDSIATPEFLDESLSFCSDLTESIEICLLPDAITPGSAYNLINSNTNQSIAQTEGICFTVNDPEKFIDGSNELIVIGEKDGCFSAESDGILILFQSPPSLTAQAIDDLIIACESEEFVTLEALNGPPEVEVKWTALTPGVDINNENSMSAIANNFFVGENLIKLTYSKDGCNDFTSDTVSIFLEPSPILEDDLVTVDFNSSKTIDIFNNDVIPSNYDLIVDDNGIKGILTNNGDDLTFNPDEGLVGTFTIDYEVCVTGCPELCETAVVTLNIGLDQECALPTIFTPNEDGINDKLIIPCLDSDRFDKNKLYVFNEWGDEVFSAEPYDNSWDGTYGSEPLPVGTYFIVFEPGNGVSPIRGFLILQR